YVNEVTGKIENGLGEYDLETLTEEVEGTINDAGGDVEVGKEEVERAIDIIEGSVGDIEDVEDLEGYGSYAELLESIREEVENGNEDVDYSKLRNDLIREYEKLLDESVEAKETEEEQQFVEESLDDTTELEQEVANEKDALDGLNDEIEGLYASISEFENKGTVTGAEKERSEEHTSELQSRFDLVCRLLLEKKKKE